jgi:hypothetical protein
MSQLSFVDKVKKYFYYLESEYGFRISSQSNPDTRPHTDGFVEYTSDTTTVVIDSETGYASVWFYRTQDGKKHYLDPVAIHEYVTTTDKEKELLLSTNPQNQRDASLLFNQKFLLNQGGWKSKDNETTEDKLETRLKNYAEWLESHANLCLKGDFSQWPNLYEYKIHRARADELRRGKDDLVYVKLKDANGNSKLIKQSMFKDDFEYIEKLKKEFQA